MLELTINGKKCTVPEGITILEAARESGMDEREVLALCGNPDGVLQRSGGRSCICYNDRRPPRRVRFTLCEEIAHHLLGHLDEPGFRMFRQDYREETYARCEAEAKYLESELSRRSRLGKAASVAGMALSMAAFTSCFQTVGEEEMPDEVMGLDPYEDSTQCEQAPEQASAAESAVEYDAEQLNINE